MKKSIIFACLLLLLGANSMAQNKTKETKVQQLTYKGFLSKIWDFEKSPNVFVFKGKTAVIVDFYADWCGPCRKVSPIMEKLANEYEGELTIYKVNIDEEKNLAAAFQISSIPTVLFIPKNDRPMMQVGAMLEQDYRKVVEDHLVNKPKQE